MIRRRVFIAGFGAITPLGETWDASLERLREGESAVRPVSGFDVTGFPSQVAAAVAREFSDVGDRRLGLARVAVGEAWRQAHLGPFTPERFGVFVGAESGRAAVATIMALARAAGGGRDFDHAQFGVNARALVPWTRDSQPNSAGLFADGFVAPPRNMLDMPSLSRLALDKNSSRHSTTNHGSRGLAARIDLSSISAAAVASDLARELGALGPVETMSMACASGLAAIAEAARAIRLGLCDVALCGGVGADIDPLMLAGFGKLQALSSRGLSCPFDARRDGFVVGEGAAMVVLTSESGALEITGLGRSLDAYHLTKPDPEGAGATRAMRAALEDAGWPLVEAIQAHGTSTTLNDEVEAKAIRRVFEDRWRTLPVSSVKGALGHWIAGAGALGFLCALEAVQSGTVLPTAGLEQIDPSCMLHHVTGKAQARNVRCALVNAFAFGGANVSVIVERTR